MSSIHPTAVIDSSAKIGSGTTVGPYSVIGAGVEIGSDCRIGPHVVISGPTKIGSVNKIYQFASVGEDPQDKKFSGEETWLEMGDNNIIREYVTIHRGTENDRSLTKVGSDNLFLAHSHIAHDCVVGDHVIFSNNASIAGHVTVGDYAILGGFALVHQFCFVGSHTFLGMGSASTQDVPDYMIAAGSPSQPKGVNVEGLKRRDYTTSDIRLIRDAYKLLYRSQLGLEDALERIVQLEDAKGVLTPLIETLRSSERGIIR